MGVDRFSGWLGSVVVGRWNCDREAQVRLPAGALLGSKSGQVALVHTHVPLSPSSIIWYRPRGGDVLRLGRYS